MEKSIFKNLFTENEMVSIMNNRLYHTQFDGDYNISTLHVSDFVYLSYLLYRMNLIELNSIDEAVKLIKKRAKENEVNLFL